MGMTLDLTRNVLNTYRLARAGTTRPARISLPFLYDNTVGDGPYNAWVDPTLADEWAELGWNNVAQMQSFGMPGVFTHGDFDTWSPGYLMFLAGMHNGSAGCMKRSATAARIPRNAYSGRKSIRAPGTGQSAAADRQLVAARQQQLRGERAALNHLVLLAQHPPLSRELLHEEQVDPEAGAGRAGCLFDRERCGRMPTTSWNW